MQVLDTLTPEQCVFDYGGFTSMFVNEQLRHQHLEREADIQEHKLRVQGIDSAMDRTFAQPFTVWRGESLPQAPRVGEVVCEAAYLSTSLLRKVGEDFANERVGIAALWQISVPAFYPHVDVAAVSTKVDPGHCLLARREQEVLIHRGSRRLVEALAISGPKPFMDSHLLVQARLI